MIFYFTHPSYLYFLLIIPVLFSIHFFSLSNRKKVALDFANFESIAKIRGIDFFSKNLFSLILSSFIILFLVFSLSGFTVYVTKDVSDFSFVLAIDSSQSMSADDFSPNRLDVSKNLASDFVNDLPFGSKIGVVSFSGSSIIESFLTTDKVQIRNAINEIQLTNYGGTDIYEAVITSSNILYNEDNKAIILLSDGQINVGSIEESIKYANKNNNIVYTLGIGTKEGGNTSFGFSKLDEDSLKSLAYNTEGKYFLVKNNSDLENSLKEIMQIKKSNVAINFSDYLLILAIFLFLIEFFLKNTRYFNLV